MIRVTWPNGKQDAAPTWDELERHVRETQWKRYATHEAFRLMMEKRAKRWSGTTIDPWGTSQEFFAELARASMIEVNNETKEV